MTWHGTSSAASDTCLHTLGSQLWILVFPNDENRPARRPQRCFRLLITFNVSSKLRGPPVGIRLWERLMLRADMPEATSDIHGDLYRRKNDVDGPTKMRQRPAMQPVAQAASMESTTKP